MKSPVPLRARRFRTGAFALVIVLGFLVLLTVLVIAFFTSVTTDYASTKQYSNGAATKQLADSAVQVVVGQIKAGTAGAGQDAAGTPVSLTWASQPGMIRTYDSAGNPAANYKLYSSDAMTTTGALTPAQVSDFDTAWQTKPAGWADLNAPVTDTQGTANFPIIDGNNIKLLSVDAAGRSVSKPYYGYDAYDNAKGPDYSTNPPRLNPDGLPDVDGFSIDPAQVSYDAAKPLSTGNTPVPVPVKWLYQLRDGTLIAPDATSKTTATFGSAAAQPNVDNPIVGRIAFWADDESAKVDINTAGQGTYWDTPHFSSTALPYSAVTAATASQFTDYAYAAFQPAIFEFQRYPGHPAQVALNTIFPGATTVTAAAVTPRIVYGGSQGGTTFAGGSAAIDLSKAARKALYASVDEYLYSEKSGTPRTANALLPPDPNTGTQKPLIKPQLEEAKFFITANSRAPEVNLFNKPRVCMWPISQALAADPKSPYTTAFDRLIAFCATLRSGAAAGGNASPFRYYFQRSDSQSATNDYLNIAENQRLYSYLHGLMAQSVPGFGSSFLSKYGPDSDQILTEIFDYIRCTNLSDPNLCPDPANPGRSTLPSLTTWAKAPYVFANYQPTSDGEVYAGQVMPIQITDPQSGAKTMGLGRYYTVKDVSMVFACVANGKAGTPTAPIVLAPTDPDKANEASIRSSNDVASQPALVNVPLNAGEKRVQMGLFLNYFLPSPGLLKCGPDMLVRISNLDQIQITGATNIDGGALFPAAAPPTASGWVGKIMATGYAGYNPVDAILKLRYQFLQHRSPLYSRSVYASKANGKIIYPFISRAFTIPTGASLALAAPVTLKIELFQAKAAYDSNDGQLANTYKAPGAPTYDGITSVPASDAATNLIQTINVTLPAGTFPQPILAQNLPPASSSASPTYVTGLPAAMSPQAAWGFDGRIASPYTGNQQASAIIAQAGSVMYDTVRTVSVLSGDGRVVAASNQVPATLFGVADTTPAVATTNYNSSVQSYHYFADNTPVIGGRSGKLVPGIGAVGTTFICPPGTEANYCLYGDWDGPVIRAGGTGAGAFINKPDEGDNSDLGTGGTSSIPYYGFAETTARNVYLYTPNRVMPSPGMLGSLPTGVQGNHPWQTLLFRPQPTHPNAAVALGGQTPAGPPYTKIPDHLIMDLFWMPVVEPYAISEPFSTAGKINLNYQIAPFTYFTRSTGMVSLLKNEKMAARPITVDQAATSSINFRLDINPSESGGTLQQCKEKFALGSIYRSATEVCDLDLVPVVDPSGTTQSWSSGWGAQFWNANANTGDNLRERPYANLYARLTTKSNSFTVHFRVQTLQKLQSADPDYQKVWVENRDKVQSEYRGSSLIERYIDPADSSLIDFAVDSSKTLDAFYKFRVVSTKKFAP